MAYSIGFDIFAKDKASATFDKLGKKVGQTEGKFSKTNTAIAVGAAAALTAVVAFGTKSVDTFSTVGSESLKLQRYMGGTIEDASRLRYAGTQSGVGVDAMATSMGKLSKAMAAGSPAFAGIGVKVKDSTGHLRSMADVMPELADKFAKMPNGAEKTALALKLFGKSGMDMMPMMNKGSAGLKALTAESDKFGNTLNSKDTAAIKENVKQKRQMGAAVEGLQIQLGRVLMPVVVNLSTKLNEMARWFDKNASTAKPLVAIVGTLVAIIGAVVAITRVYTAVQTALNIVLTANPVGLIIVAIGLLVAGIVLIATKTTVFQDTWRIMVAGVGALWRGLWNNILAPIIRFVLGGFASITDGIANMLGVLSNIPGFGWAKTAADKMKGAADKARDLANGIKDIPNKKDVRVNIGVSLPRPGSPELKALLGPAGSKYALVAPRRAAGGPVRAGTSYLINEEGQEMFTPGSDGYVTNARDTARALAGRGGSAAGGGRGGGTTINVHVNGQVYGSTTDLANVVLTGLQRLKGSGTRLGLA